MGNPVLNIKAYTKAFTAPYKKQTTPRSLYRERGVAYFE
jgi:hypothetical protein